MRRLNLIVPLIVCGVLLLSSVDGLAQEDTQPTRPLRLYKVDFALHEGEDSKRINTRHYELLIEEGAGRRPAPEGFGRQTGFGRIRANTKVPIFPDPNAVQYMDVGLKIDCDVRQIREGDILLIIALEISNFADPGQANSRQPLIREIRSEVSTAVEPKKPTIVAVVDDAATKRRYELEVTVTKVK